MSIWNNNLNVNAKATDVESVTLFFGNDEIQRKHLSKKKSKDFPKRSPKDFPSEFSTEFPKTFPKEAPKDIPKEIPKKILKNAIFQPIPKEFPKTIPKECPKGSFKCVTAAIPKDFFNEPLKDFRKEKTESLIRNYFLKKTRKAFLK